MPSVVTKPGVLLIDYGDLPSLAAVALQSRPDEVMIFHPRGRDAAAGGRETAALGHAEILGAEIILVDLLPEIDAGGSGGIAGTAAAGWETDRDQAMDDACVLMHVVATADRMACPMILWPRQVGPDADAVGRAVLRANLVVDVVEVGAGPGAVGRLAIDMPLVDLTDHRLVELAEEGGAPMRAFWPCDSGGRPARQPCHACEGCRRWASAFETAGSPWPWTTVPI